MDKRKQYIGLGILAVIVIAVVAYFTIGSKPPPPPPKVVEASVPVDIAATPQTMEAMKRAGPIAGTPLYGVHAVDMPPTNIPWTCKDAATLRARADSNPTGAQDNTALPTGVFWESQSVPDQFIYYEYKSRITVVCDGKTIAATVAPDRGISSREEVVKFDQPHFGDWEHNGKFEFIVFRGQCASGPCVGLFHLIQMDGTTVRKLAEFNANGVDTEQMSIQSRSRTSLQVHATCFTNDYTPAFEYMTVLDYGGPNILTMVTPQQIRVRSPELLQRMATPAGLVPDASKEQVAYGKIQHVIYEAYQGQPLAKLKDEYQKIVSVFPGGQAPVQCDPMAILTMVTEGK